MRKLWQMHHHAGTVCTLQPRNYSDFSLDRHDNDDGDNSSDIEEEDDGDYAVVRVPSHDYCPCNNEHFMVLALDNVYPGTVESFHHLLFNSSLVPKLLKKYENCFGKPSEGACCSISD